MKLSFKNLAIIAGVTSLAVTGAALANYSAGKGKSEWMMQRAEQVFEKIDSDGDGKINVEDAKAFAAERFAARDTDSDGVISREERKKFRTENREERSAERFAKLDADGDGMISPEEFKQAKSERRGHKMGGHHRKHGHRMGGMMRGPLTLEEAKARAQMLFERVDQDENGTITLEEVKSFKPRFGRRG